MAYRATPLDNGYSPAELLFSRRLRTHIPLAPELLKPSVADAAALKASEHKARSRQELNYNRRHAARERPEFQPAQKVWIKDLKRTGTVLAKADAPRSYIIGTDQGTVRRNAKFLVVDRRESAEEDQVSVDSLPPPRDTLTDTPSNAAPLAPPSPQAAGPGTRSRSGRLIRPPRRYGYT